MATRQETETRIVESVIRGRKLSKATGQPRLKVTYVVGRNRIAAAERLIAKGVVVEVERSTLTNGKTFLLKVMLPEG